MSNGTWTRRVISQVVFLEVLEARAFPHLTPNERKVLASLSGRQAQHEEKVRAWWHALNRTGVVKPLPKPFAPVRVPPVNKGRPAAEHRRRR
jgi:hypothetical protein